MSPNLSFAEENYIKHIYHLQQREGHVTTNALAASIKAKPASITDMLKKLKAKKLVNYQPYKEFQLSLHGKKMAIEIVRRHRLWEFFLAEKLQFGWDEVHEIAEELEHVSSKKLIEKLDEFLEYPRFDPHGDPIPDCNGKITQQPQINLNELAFNTTAQVTSVSGQSAILLEMLKQKNISIGTQIEIKKRFEFDNSLEIKIKNQSPVTISEQLAKTLFVQHV